MTVLLINLIVGGANPAYVSTTPSAKKVQTPPFTPFPDNLKTIAIFPGPVYIFPTRILGNLRTLHGQATVDRQDVSGDETGGLAGKI